MRATCTTVSEDLINPDIIWRLQIMKLLIIDKHFFPSIPSS